MGPTASGKTELALALAHELPIEIINVDSAQIYRQMDIGSGKPSHAERQVVPHHLMDILDPIESYSAAQFCLDATRLIKEITTRGKLPVLVGGTMLYFKALQQGLAELPRSSLSVRAAIIANAEEQGWEALYQELNRCDPLTAARLKPTDKQRIGRALEVFKMTGKPLSSWLATTRQQAPSIEFINIALISLATPRSVLHERIAARFDKMLTQGLVAEVEKLYARGDLDLSFPSIRAVGYRQVWQYLAQTHSYEEMRTKAIAATRQLAKRQLTWLRSWPALVNLDFLDPKLLFHILKQIK